MTAEDLYRKLAGLETFERERMTVYLRCKREDEVIEAQVNTVLRWQPHPDLFIAEERLILAAEYSEETPL